MVKVSRILSVMIFTNSFEATFTLLERAGALPDRPESLDGAILEVSYSSPSSQSQYATRLSDIQAFMQDVAPLAQIKPEILQALNEQKLLESYSKFRNLDPQIVKSEQEFAQMQQEQAEAQQQEMAMQSAPPIAGAMKDIAQAKQADPEGMGQLLNI